jgi:hypothetical protein
MSLFEDASLIVTPNAQKAGKLYAIKPDSGAGDLDVVRATEATRVNSAGLIEVVANNVPRLDYTNGSCPSILVEPQRTNLLAFSEDSNSWQKDNIGSINSDFEISPNGTQNADKINFNSGNSFVRPLPQGTISTVSSSSFFVKYVDYAFFQIMVASDGLQFANFDIQNGVIGTVGANASASIEDYGNGWYRIILRTTGGVFGSSPRLYKILNLSALWSIGGGGAGSALVWGAQLEVGSNATSYIPTVASTVTRNADVISKTGISDLIGQTEGTICIDANISKFIQNSSRIFIDIVSTNDANRIYIDIPNTVNGNTIQTAIRANSIFQVVSQLKLFSLGKVKLAIAYKNGDCAFYINGESINFTTNNSFFFSSNLDLIHLGSRANIATSPLNDSINNILIFKTRLSNSQLAQLTTL